MEGFSVFAYVAILLLAGLFSTRLMRLLKLPNVTGYIITGILFGPFVLGLFFHNFTMDGIKDGPIFKYVQSLGWISQVALGFIAFSIGSSFRVSTIKSLGKRVLIITIFEALGGSLIVIAGLLVAHAFFPEQVPMELVLTLGAIAAATAPAATLMVIKQYRARGKLVDTLLPVVALDDAVALILFAVLFQIATTIAGGGEFSAYKMIAKPLIEICLSLAIGSVLGLFISWMNRYFKSRNNRLAFCIFTVFAALGFYILFRQPYMGEFELSSLLICMMAGAFYASLRHDSGPTLDVLERFTSPVYMMFFIISGASLDLSIFFSDKGFVVLAIAGTYLVCRVIGKYGGAFAGASLTRCEPEVRNYLGLALVPQAGVAIGLATTASTLFNGHESGAMILAVILTSTLVYELIGPMVSKFALQKAGQIPMDRPVSSH